MSLIQGQTLQKFDFLRAILAALGSQGIVVNCTAAIFFPTVDCVRMKHARRVSRLPGVA